MRSIRNRLQRGRFHFAVACALHRRCSLLRGATHTSLHTNKAVNCLVELACTLSYIVVTKLAAVPRAANRVQREPGHVRYVHGARMDHESDTHAHLAAVGQNLQLALAVSRPSSFRTRKKWYDRQSCTTVFCTYKKMTVWKPNEYSSTPKLPSLRPRD